MMQRPFFDSSFEHKDYTMTENALEITEIDLPNNILHIQPSPS